MQLPQYLKQLYDYNCWANAHFLDAAAGLEEAELFKDLGHSWGSVYGVLLHMLTAEWIWLLRCKGYSPPGLLESADYPDVAALRTYWTQIEREMRAFIAIQTLPSLEGQVTYSNTRGEVYHLPLWQILVHVANHATHHRGELAAMFASLDVPHPEEDWLFYFLIESGQRKS